jgi:hypothetical protein
MNRRLSQRSVESRIADAGPEVRLLASKPSTAKLEMIFLQQTRAQCGGALLLHLPEQHSCTHLCRRLPDIGLERRIYVSKLRLEPGLPGR